MGSASSSKSKQSNWSEAQSNSTSMGRNTQDVWGPQAGGLADLYEGARSLLSGGQPAQDVASVGGQARDAWMQALTPGGNPFFSQNMDNTLKASADAFTRSVLPELESRGVGAGQYGNSRDQLARGEAAGMFGDSLNRQAGQMAMDQYNTDMGARGQALGMTGAMQQAQLAPQYAARDLLGGPTVLSDGWQSSISQSLASSGGKGKSGSGSVGGK